MCVCTCCWCVWLGICRRPCRGCFWIFSRCNGRRSFAFLLFFHPGHWPLTIDMLKLLHLLEFKTVNRITPLSFTGSNSSLFTTKALAIITSHTFLRINDITPMRVRTCCRDSPSRGTPSANVSAPSAPGSHRWRIKRDTYALKNRESAQVNEVKINDKKSSGRNVRLTWTPSLICLASL